MSDVNALAGEIGSLFIGVAKDIYAKFKQEDKDDLAAYAKNVAALAIKLKTEQDPAKRAAITDNLNTYQNAALLMIARYEIVAANSLEKAGVAALNLVAGVIVKIILAAL
jgi:hypothetical protein